MHKLNLIPEEHFKASRKKRTGLSFIFVGLVIFMSFGVIKYKASLSDLKTELEELNKSIFLYRSSFGSEQDIEKLYFDLQERTKIIDALSKDRAIWSDHLRKILQSPPPGLILTYIDIDGNGNGIIRGISPDNSSIAHVIENLKQNGDEISEVQLGFINKESEKNFYTFEIIFRIQGNDLVEQKTEPT